MTDLPPRLLDVIVQAIVEPRQPAFLQVDREGRLLDFGGPVSRYGLAEPVRFQPAADQFPFLTGLLPFSGSHTTLEHVSIGLGAPADVHILPSEEPNDGQVWIVLLDATREVQTRGALQQRLYDALLSGSAIQTEAAIHSELFGTLNLLAIERLEGGKVQVIEPVPAWMARYCDSACSGEYSEAVMRAFPFLDNFLADATQFWDEDVSERLGSGPWVETDRAGHATVFEAFALRIGTRKLLLVEPLGESFDDKASIIQTAREQSLLLSRLERDRQHLEILFHCIAHDLAGMLTGIKGPLSLMLHHPLSPEVKSLVELAMRQAARQQGLLQDLLDTLVAEAGAQRQDAASLDTADVCETLRDVIAGLSAGNQTKSIRFDITEASPFCVHAGKRRLERVFWNLIENGLRYTPRGRSVVVTLSRERGDVLVQIDDEGPGVSEDMIGRLFSRFARGSTGGGKAGLGLYFCKITVEQWGGSIGYEPRAGGGSRFWVRLPEMPGSCAQSAL